ncbi:MAG: hypothetical protein IJK40_09625 [Clostridia bacterium]|nr:hypothetical protein [Clostridia bacterium]
MSNISAISRDEWMLRGPLAKKGYDWWWHNFTAENAKTGEKKPFYIEFFTCNPAFAEDEPVIVWNDPVARAAGKRPSYLMINVGFWGETHGQLHRFISLKKTEIHADAPYSVRAADCFMNETHTFGSVKITPEEAEAHPEWMCNAGEMTWNLKIDKKIAFNVGYGASRFFRKINAFEMFWHAEGMKTEFEGTVTLNGEEYIVRPETCNGYADKNWGGDFTRPWVWLSSNNIQSGISGDKLNNSVFEIGGGRPKIFFLALNRKLLGTFFYEGRDYEFNFSKFWTGSRTQFESGETEDEIWWHVEQTTFKAKMVTDIRCKKSEMLNINYEAPNGTKRHNRLWNGGTGYGTLKLYEKKKGKYELIDEMTTEGVGCEYGEYDQ